MALGGFGPCLGWWYVVRTGFGGENDIAIVDADSEI